MKYQAFFEKPSKYFYNMIVVFSSVFIIFIFSNFVHYFLEHAEADSFFCFTNIMSEIRDNFIKTLDDSDLGIGKLI